MNNTHVTHYELKTILEQTAAYLVRASQQPPKDDRADWQRDHFSTILSRRNSFHRIEGKTRYTKNRKQEV